MKKTVLIMLLVFCYSPFLLAGSEKEKYVGLHYSQVNYDDEGFPKEAKPIALIGRYGYFLYENFSVEGRLGYGLADETLDFGVDVDIKVDNIYGIYGLYHLSKNIASFYGLLGLSKGELTSKRPGISESEDESGLSYGIGMDIKSFNIEYIMYLDEGTFEASAISLGFIYEF